MQEYYDIIGRKKKEPPKSVLLAYAGYSIFPAYFLSCVACAICHGIKTGRVSEGFLALFAVWFLGIVLIPVSAFSAKTPLSIIICAIFIVLFLVLIVLSIANRKPSKNEQSKDLKLQLIKKEFEAKYPRAVEVKKEYFELQKSHNQAKKTIADALASTSITKINADFTAGRISREERDKMIELYQICEYHASQQKFLDEVNRELCDRLKTELAGYVAEFEK